jgi:AcrR family transcriptional regulator
MKTLDPVMHQIREEALLQRARHLFATKGFTETSMDDIAHTSHMQKASLYHYFTSKQQLLQKIVDLEGARWLERLKEYEAGTDLRDTLSRIGRAFLEDMDDPRRREYFKIIYFESHKNPAILEAMKESPTNKRGALFAIFLKHLEHHYSRKEIAMLTTQFMGGLIHFATQSRLRGENMCLEKFSDAEYVQQMVDLFVRGLRLQ